MKNLAKHKASVIIFQDKVTNNSQLIATIKLWGERKNKEFSKGNT